MADRARRMVQLAGAGAARYSDEEVDETVAFLEWLLHDNFIFLGYREYRIRDDAITAVPDSGLGILSQTEKSNYAKPVPIASLPPGVRERALDGDLLIVSKTNRLARVHRRVRMDYIGVRRISAEGEIVGEARMLGLFTTKAYAEPASQTPLLNRKLRQILRSEDLIEGSHDYKAAVSLFDSFPKDELFAAPTGGPPARGRRAARAAGRPGAAARPPRRRRAQRVADRRAAALALRRRAARAAPGPALRALRHRRRRLPPRARRGRPRAGPLPRPRLRGPARGRHPRARGRGRQGHADVGRRASPGAGGAPRRAAGAGAVDRLGPALPALLQGRDERGAGRPRHRLLRTAGDARRAVRGRAAERVRPARRAHPRRPLQERRQGRAGRGDADARGPRPAGHRGDPDAAARRRRRHLGAGLRRARSRRPADRARRPRRSRRRLHLGGLARRHRVRLAEPARAAGRARLAPDRDPARVPQVPPAHRLALHRELPERRAGRERGDHRATSSSCSSCASTPSARATRGPRTGCASGSCARSTTSSRSTTTASCATSSG